MNNLPGAQAIRLWVSRWFHCDYTGMIATQKHWRGRWGFRPFCMMAQNKSFCQNSPPRCVCSLPAGRDNTHVTKGMRQRGNWGILLLWFCPFPQMFSLYNKVADRQSNKEHLLSGWPWTLLSFWYISQSVCQSRDTEIHFWQDQLWTKQHIIKQQHTHTTVYY